MRHVYRPSSKLILVSYVFIALIFFVGVWAYFQYLPDKPAWLVAIPAVLFLMPIKSHIRQRSVKLTLEDDHLILETGLLAKRTRTINIAKVQDVTVNQSVGQRMLGLGDVTVESAGESSSMLAHGFDSPKEIASVILKAAHAQSSLNRPGI